MSVIHKPPVNVICSPSVALLDPIETKCRIPSHMPHAAPEQANRCVEAAGNITANPAQVFRHSGWSKLRTRVRYSLVRTRQKAARYESFATCGRRSYILMSSDDPPKYRVAGSHCHDRFCIPCSLERSSTITHNVMDHVGQRKTRFVTLTLKHRNCTLGVALDHLYSSWTKLRKQARWSGNVTGGIAFVEIIHSKNTGCWHPHIHALIEGRYYPQVELSKDWYTATGDSVVVDIRLVRGTSHVARYVTKYASKPMNNTFQYNSRLLDDAVVGLKGRRLAMTFGSWRGIKLSDTLPESGWENIGTLNDFLYQATHGDADASNILLQIDPTSYFVACSFIKSTSSPPTIEPLASPVQGTLFPMATICF